MMKKYSKSRSKLAILCLCLSELLKGSQYSAVFLRKQFPLEFFLLFHR